MSRINLFGYVGHVSVFLNVHYRVLFSSGVRVGIRVRIRFSVWSASCYAHRHGICATLGCNCHGPEDLEHWASGVDKADVIECIYLLPNPELTRSRPLFVTRTLVHQQLALGFCLTSFLFQLYWPHYVRAVLSVRYQIN